MASDEQNNRDLNSDLIAAAEESDLEKVKALIEQGASAAYVHKEEGTWGARSCKGAIHGALRNKNYEMVKCLLEHGALTSAVIEDYDWRGCGNSQTALSMASKLDPDFLLLFLNNGADPNDESKSSVHSMRSDGNSTWRLIHTAVERKQTRSVEGLIQAKADIAALKTTVRHNERGYNSNDSQNALHLACGLGCVDIVGVLLDEAERRGMHGFVNEARSVTEHRESGAVSPTDDPREEGYLSPVVCVQVTETPLHLALRGAHRDLARLLLARGARLDVARRAQPPDGAEESTSCDSLAAAAGLDLAALAAEPA